jgi:uncharacterized membrane protein
MTKTQRKFIKRNYRNLSVEQMARKLKLKPEQVQQMIKNLGFKPKSENIFFKKIDGEFFNQYAGLIVSILAAGYVIFFTVLSICRYRVFHFNDQDWAIYAQTVWNILHGSTYTSILRLSFLGNHFSLILFLVVPIYAIFRTPLTLLFLQSLLVGLGAWPIYLLSKDALDKKFAICFSFSYLIFPALSYGNYYEFQPIIFVTFFLLFMFYYFEKERFFPFICFMLLSLLCKENISLGVLFFGCYVIFFSRRAWKWSLTPLAAGALWFVCVLKIKPYFNQNIIQFDLIYGHLGKSLPEVIFNIFRHPGFTLKLVFADANIKFLSKLLFPLLFLSLLCPKTLFISLPFFLQQLLSRRGVDHTIRFHYAAKLVPFLFISAIHGTKFLLRFRFFSRYRWSLIGGLLIASILSNFWFGPLPKIWQNFSSHFIMEEIDYKKQELIDEIPKDASVVATFEFLPKLSHRKELYSFQHAYVGKHTLSQKDYVLPKDVEYALIDFNDYLTFTGFYHPARYKNIQKIFEKERWGLLTAVDNIVLLRRGYKSNSDLYKVLKKITPLSSIKLSIEDNITVWGYNIENKKVRPGQTIHISFIWECLRQARKDYWLIFKIIDKEEKVLHRYNHPICYQINPTYVWKKGDIIKENMWILVPSKIKEKDVWLKMGIIDRSAVEPRGGVARGVPVRTNKEGMFDKEGWIELGRIEVN